MFDVVEALNDGFRRERGGSPSAEVPLQVTDPEDEVGDGGGAGIHLESLELVRIDGESGFVQSLLRFATSAAASSSRPSKGALHPNPALLFETRRRGTAVRGLPAGMW